MTTKKFKVQRRKTKTSEWEDSAIDLTDTEIWQQNHKDTPPWDRVRKAE